MKAPVGLSSRQSGLRSKCRVFSAARTGTHEKGAARPFQTPKGLSKPKNASRFAKRIFWASPIYGSAEGVTFQQDFTFSKGVKSAAKQQIGETRKKRNSDDRRLRRIQGGAVGAAASRMRAAAKQTLGAATRLSAAASIFGLRQPLWGLKGASSPFLVDPARRNRWWFSGSLLTSKENNST